MPKSITYAVRGTYSDHQAVHLHVTTVDLVAYVKEQLQGFLPFVRIESRPCANSLTCTCHDRWDTDRTGVLVWQRHPMSSLPAVNGAK